MEDKHRLELWLVLGVVTAIVCLLVSKGQGAGAGAAVSAIVPGTVVSVLPTAGGPATDDTAAAGVPAYQTANITPFGKRAVSYIPQNAPTTNSGGSADFSGGYYIPVGA